MIGLNPCNRILHQSTAAPRPRPRGRNAFRPTVEALEPRRTPTVSFLPQQTFAVGTAPEFLAVGDFNGDGKPDLAVPSQADKAVSVLLNTAAAGSGAASFAAQQTFAAGTTAYCAAVADFNGDGKPDLAVSNEGDKSVSVLLNQTAPGSGVVTFLAQQTFAVGTGPFFVAAADVNGDGRPDLVTPNTGDKTVSVLLNTTPAGTPLPTFAAQKTFAVGTAPEGVAAADVNGDGRPDLAIANFMDKTVSLLLNTTSAGADTPTFAPQKTFATGTGPNFMVAADINGDGRPDLAMNNFVDSTVSVLLNTAAAGAGAASFAPQQTFATGTFAIAAAAGDFDGDGRPDLAVTSDTTKVSVLLNTTAAGSGTASFAALQTFATGNTPAFVATADFNVDGHVDLAVVANGDKAVGVLLNSTAPSQPNTGTFPVLVGQFGGTGVWQFNQALNTWVQLTPANANALAADPQGDVAGAFKGAGVWRYRRSSGSWTQIGTSDATLLAMDALGDLAGEFPGAGVWLFRPASGWTQIGTGDASVLAMDALGDAVGTFPGHGAWLFRPAVGFQQIGSGDASVMTMDALGDVIGTFPGHGVWEYRQYLGFQQTGVSDATALAADPYGNVVGSFPGAGVFQYQPAVGWRPLLPAVAQALGMDALGAVFGAFPGFGVWQAGAFRFGTQLRAADAYLLVVA
jgi:hypothetical protein